MRNKWAVLTVISAALFLVGIDMTVLYTALPTLTHELQASNDGKLWIINAYPLVMAGLLLGLGTLGDKLGHRGVFMSGLAVFGVASLLASFAISVETLIAGRALLAVGAAMMMPASLALVRQTFVTDKERAIAIGIWGSVYSGAAALGPLIGGLLLAKFWWGSVFLINVPVVIAALILTPLLVERRNGDPTRPWHIANSLLIMVGLVGLTYALKELAKPEINLLHGIIATLVGGIFMTWFIKRQTKSSSPLVDFGLFRNSMFLAGMIAMVVAMVALMGVQLVLTQRLQLVEGMSPLQAGLYIIPISIASFFSGPIFGSALHRIGIARALWLALFIGAAGLVGFILFKDGPLALQLFSFALFGFGAGATMSTSSTAVMINAPEEKAGMAASLEAVSYELGGVLGVAIMGSIATFLYSTSLSIPDGIPDPAMAKDSLDQALLLAEGLGGIQAEALVASAKTAFDNAYLGVAMGGAGMMALMGTIFALWLRASERSHTGA